MNEYNIYRNFKRWLVTEGTCLLDLLLPVFNENATDPSERYENLAELLDKHFNLLAYYGMQLQPNLPLILLSFNDITGNTCFPEYRVS